MAELGAGDVFAGYTIEGVAGRGGMGVVYRASQARPRRIVALKVIADTLVADSAFRTRFERESDIAASIEHPNVIPVYEAGEERGRVFIAMRYVDGVDLGTAIAREGRFRPARAARIITQLGGALDAAHARGLVHRDVKPANVLLTGAAGDEQVYLTDFGVSKRTESRTGITETGEFVGTVDYIAPEQIEGGHADARSDVYSIGCLFYEAVTGRVPFPRQIHAAKLYAHLRDPPPPASEMAPGLPHELDSVVARAMAKDPDRRYQSAGEFARAVNAVVDAAALPETEPLAHGLGQAAPPNAAAGGPPADTVRAGRPRAQETQAAPQPSSRRAVSPGRRLLWPGFLILLVGLAALAGLLVARSSDDGSAAPSDAQVRSALESYSARYTAGRIDDLASLLAPDFKRYVAGNPPQSRAETVAAIKGQLKQAQDPRYTFDGAIRIERQEEGAVATTRYRIQARRSPRVLRGLFATGSVSFRVRLDGDEVVIDETRVAPDILLVYVLAPGSAPTEVVATASVQDGVTTQPAGTGSPQEQAPDTTIAEKAFRLRRDGTHLLELPLNEAGRRGLRWGAELTIEYRENGRLTNRATARFTEQGYLFR